MEMRISLSIKKRIWLSVDDDFKKNIVISHCSEMTDDLAIQAERNLDFPPHILLLPISTRVLASR